MSDIDRDDVIAVSGFIKSVWWLWLVRGILAIILGILIFVWPQQVVTTLIWIFGLYLLIDGIVSVFRAFGIRKEDRTWGWALTGGIVSVIAGLIILFHPGVSAAIIGLFVLWVIAIWAVGGIFGIPAAATGAKGGARVLGIILAALAIVFGIILAISLFNTPEKALSGLVWLVALYAVISGIVLIIGSFIARSEASKALKAAGA